MRYPFITLTVMVLFFNTSSYAQSCFNSDFETGDASGYTTYIGSIGSDGSVVIEQDSLATERHKIMHFLDGFDPIAMEYCTENKELPVVPLVGGQYAMRLGNDRTGRGAERVVIKFVVTSENNFFLLRYAVVLDDPNHAFYEQPRFELSILDSNGAAYPCGEYNVRAGPDIPNFENCGSWRVRPWTNIGVELQSYIGEEIQIQLLTTDCSQGGHAGYAYFDASCQPLQIELLNYCEGVLEAQMQVTPGFDKYLWSTGDTSSMINILDPSPGELYFVTVTSATGCDLILSDTIPAVEVIGNATFDESTVSHFCQEDTAFFFNPPGQNIDRIYSLDYNRFLDSFLIRTDARNQYTFVAYNDSGCGFDTVKHHFYARPTPIEIITPNPCANGRVGRIELNSTNGLQEFNFLWEDGSTDSIRENLSTGVYAVTVTDQWNCTNELEYRLSSETVLRFNARIEKGRICKGDKDGAARMNAYGGNTPYEYSYDSSQTFTDNNSFEDFGPDSNLVIVRDANGCMDSLYVIINEFEIDDIRIEHTQCAEDNGQIRVLTSYNDQNEYSIDGENFETNNRIDSLAPGDYTVVVRNQEGCMDSLRITIDSSFLPVITVNVQEVKCYGALTGAIYIQEDSLTQFYRYRWENNNTAPFIENLGFGSYRVSVYDQQNCENVFEYEVPQIDSMVLTMEGRQDSSCYDQSMGSFKVFADGGTPPYIYSIGNTSSFDTITLFSDLAPGIHEVIVKDSNQCLKRAFYTIESFAKPEGLSVATVADSCGHETGSIVINNLQAGRPPFEFSMNNEPYTLSNSFRDLSDGDYEIRIRDDNGCTKDTIIRIDYLEEVLFTNAIIDSTYCNESNGSISVTADTNIENEYFLNAQSNGSSNSWTNLPPDQYELIVRNKYLCMDTIIAFVGPSITPSLTDVDLIYYACNDLPDTAIVVALGGEPPLRYSKDGIIYQDLVIFENLEPGTNTLYVKDQNGCIDMKTINVSTSEPIKVDKVDFKDPDCGITNGEISIEVSGGFQDIFINENLSSYLELNNLEDKNYVFQISDASNCYEELEVNLQSECELFIPNVFSPNGDQINDRFELISNESAQAIVHRYQIFDRWGSLVYSMSDFQLTQDALWWDGRRNGKVYQSGVFVYQIEVSFSNGQIEKRSGDVTLIR